MLNVSQTALVLKLGSNCNLDCSYCHSTKMDLSINPKVFDFIKENNFKRITFSGGEPFLYFDLIKEIIEYVDKPEILYRSPTNGTVITTEMIEFLNKHNFQLYLSYDGKNTNRDISKIINYHVLTRFKNKVGISSVIHHEFNYRRATNDIINLVQNRLNYSECHRDINIKFNMLHQTSKTSNAVITEEDVDRHIEHVCYQLDKSLFNYTRNNISLNNMPYLRNFVSLHNNATNITIGVQCCNNVVLNMNISGEFIICPYDRDIIGSIDTGLDLNIVNNRIPDQCKICDIFSFCRNQCIANVTNNECRFIKTTFKHFLKLCKKYNININNLISNLYGV